MHVIRPWQRLLLWLGVGSFSGFLWAASLPRPYQASITVHFPSTNRPLIQKLLGALESDEGREEALNLMADPMDNGRSAELAREILCSRAAVAFASRQGERVLTPDELEKFRARDLRIELRPTAVLEIQILGPQADAARLQCQRLLEYYDQFVQQNPLTPTGRVRRSLEKRYAKIREQLRDLELKVAARRGSQTRELGDEIVGLGGSTAEELARRRNQQQQLGRVVLDRLRKVRTDLEQESVDPMSQTLAAENQAGKSTRYEGTDIPRPADLTNRVRLERNYEDSTALHRMLLLQHGLLRTLEDLEQVEYTVIDPLSVHRRALGLSWLMPALVGAGVGMLVGLLTLPSPRK